MDLIIGDPYGFPHPVIAIGKLISFLDKSLMDKKVNADIRNKKIERVAGLFTLITVCLITVLCSVVIWILSYRISVILGIIIEALMTSFVLAAKGLKTESMKVYYPLEKNDIEAAKYAVSMIVGRDTDKLDETGIIKATVETIAENTSDGVIAPMLFTALFGPAGGMLYKAVNTCDSMIGYKNDRYENFGYFAAKTDDVFNFIPARISAIFMIIASFILPGYDGRSAYRIFIRDRYNHKSPNSAQTESVCAGALLVRLAGPASYFGKIVDKPYIGDDEKKIEIFDIVKANRLMYMTTYLALFAVEMLMCASIILFGI